jgi:PAS domain S-box-containing protein
VEEALWQKTHDLGERVKELNCLYGIANLVEQQDISLEEILQRTVDLIPPSWQYPEITCARIIIQDREWKTKNFRETIWKQTSDIKTHGELSGNLEVYYLEENPEIDEGPFLREERNLINAIAMLTGRIVERKQGEEILRASEEKYRTFLETTSEGCWLINPELKTVEVNDTLCKMLGYSKDEMIGKTPFDFVDDENRKIFIEQTLKISTTLHRSYEITLKNKNGEDLQTYFNATTIKNESGEVQGAFALITDITERKQTEKEIISLKDKYEDLYSNAPIMYLSIDTNGIIIECNNTVLDKIGYTKREIIGKNMTKFVTKESAASFKKDFPKLLKTGKILGVERQLVAKNREIIDVILDVTVEYGEHGKPIKTRATFKDITKRKLVEKALRESEAQKRAILDASVDRLRYVDKDMKIIWANKATAMELDISSEDLVGQTCYKLFIGRDTPCEECVTVKARETGKNEQSVIYQPKIKGIEGGSYWDSHCVPLKNDAGEIESFIQIARNITDQKQAMAALQESKDTLQAILTASPIGIGLVHNRTFDWVNKAMYNMLGYEEGSLLGETARILYPDEKEYDRAGRELYDRLEENGIGHVETRWVKKGGDAVYCYLQASPLDRSDPDKGIIVAVMDITERKQAEDLVRNFSQKLIQAQERERQMISYELHDRIAQNLSWLKISLGTFFKGHSDISSELIEKMKEFSNLTEQSIIAVRDLSYDLRPPGLDEMGLVTEIEIYCEEFYEKTGLKIDFQSAGMHKLNLTADTKIHLYRLIQEGLNNIHKHADAGQVTIKLVGASPNIILRIEDDGKGFDVKARKLALDNEKRMGLRSMQERVNLLQGQMMIQSRQMKGTKIFIKLAYLEQDNESKEKRINH